MGQRVYHAEVPSSAKVARDEGGSNSVVESQPSKLLVAGSIPVSRSTFFGLISRRMLTCPVEAPTCPP